jgi:hypothetical protein
MMDSNTLSAARTRVPALVARKREGHLESFGVVPQYLRKRRQAERIRQKGIRPLSAFKPNGKFRRNARPPVRSTTLERSLRKGRDIRSTR